MYIRFDIWDKIPWLLCIDSKKKCPGLMWCLFPFRWSRVRTPKQWSIYAGICIGGHTLITRNRSIRKTHHFSTLRKSTAWLKFQLKHRGSFPWWCWDPPPLRGENECEVGARKFWLWCWLRKRFTIGCHPTQCLWSYLVPHWSQQSVCIHTQVQRKWQWQHC